MVYLHPTIGNDRIISNGGGNGTQDLVTIFSGAKNCEEHCSWFEGAGYFDSNAVAIAKAYYSKCFERLTSQPLNGRRIAFLSQVGTMDIDPALPRNFGVVNATPPCRRIV